jgi:hypothetical protein
MNFRYQVSGLRRDEAASSAQAGFRFQLSGLCRPEAIPAAQAGVKDLCIFDFGFLISEKSRCVMRVAR